MGKSPWAVNVAILKADADTGEQPTWSRFQSMTTVLALKLLDAGYRKGDFLATSLPLLTQHVVLGYACFQIGVVAVPLDMRGKGEIPPMKLTPEEVALVRGGCFFGGVWGGLFSFLNASIGIDTNNYA
jgi:acyl-CoA synthetase (AMP-forming)/AMP-acid ligase II